MIEPAAFKDFGEDDWVEFFDEVRWFMFGVGFLELINDILLDLLSLDGEGIENVFEVGKCVIFRLDNLVIVGRESFKWILKLSKIDQRLSWVFIVRIDRLDSIEPRLWYIWMIFEILFEFRMALFVCFNL